MRSMIGHPGAVVARSVTGADGTACPAERTGPGTRGTGVDRAACIRSLLTDLTDAVHRTPPDSPGGDWELRLLGTCDSGLGRHVDSGGAIEHFALPPSVGAV
jgi:hypothetical protein